MCKIAMNWRNEVLINAKPRNSKLLIFYVIKFLLKFLIQYLLFQTLQFLDKSLFLPPIFDMEKSYL